MFTTLKTLGKTVSNIHIPDGSPDIFLFATPRGGSTWFMELVACQPGFRYCDEPLNIRSAEVRQYSGFASWEELYQADANVKYAKYFKGILEGTINFRNPNPLKPHYRFLTRRVIVKAIHGGTDRINWFRNQFNARILYCLRHPVAVSLSREEVPFLPHFLSSDYKNRFSPEQLEIAREIISSGSKLQKGVLGWCLHNSAPLKNVSPDWAVVTYEQAVIDPDPLIAYLCEKLELPDPARIYKQLNIPSGVIGKSDAVTQQLLRNGPAKDKRAALVRKWTNKVSEDEAREAMSLLEIFGIDAYQFGNLLPSDKYWIGDKPADIR